MKPRCRCGLVVWWTVLLLAASGWGAHAQNTLDEARRLYWAEAFDAAIPAYRAHLASHPGDVPAEIELGYCLLRMNRLDEAWRVLRRPVVANQAGVEAATTWIDLSLKTGNARAAQLVSRRLYLQYGNNPDIARIHARVLEASGALEAAAGVWRRSLRLWPDRADALKALGRLRADRGDSAGAESILRQYHEAQPDDAEGTALLARTLGWQWEWDEADELVERGLAAHPEHPDLLQLQSQSVDYFAPRLRVGSFWWRDTEDWRRFGFDATAEVVIEHRALVNAGYTWTRFHETDPGLPVIRRDSYRVGAGWIGPRDLRIEATYTRHDADQLGRSSAFHVLARRELFGSVVGFVSAGRDDVTEKAFSLFGKISAKFGALGFYQRDEAVSWSLSFSRADYSDDVWRFSVRSDLELRVIDPVFARWNNNTFWQNDQSFFYFGPRRYTEQELVAVFRPCPEGSPWFVEVRGGGQWADSDDEFGFGNGGEFGYLFDAKVEFRASDRVSLSVRYAMDRLRADTPFTGSGAEGAVEIRF